MNKLVFFFWLIHCSLVFSQVNDASLWTEFEIQKKINLRQSIGISENLRLVENFTQVSTHFTQLNYQYKFTKKFSGVISYRFAQRYKYDGTMSFRNRFMFDLNYKIKFKAISISIRERFQQQFQNALRTNWKDYTTTFRSKITFQFDLEKKLEPFVSGEVFLLNFILLNNIRFEAGLNFEFSKYFSVQLAYTINKQLNIVNPTTFYIIAPSLKYCF